MKLKNQNRYIVLFLLLFGVVFSVTAQNQHPRLNLTRSGVEAIRAQWDQAPLFAEQVKSVRAEVDAEIALGIDVPVPKDMSGGYTHERHKMNWFMLQKAGGLYQITGEEKYAVYVRDMLLAYAKLYPTLGLHPTNRSYATGKIFWQCLNDANWLVYVSQAYDCVYDWLKPEERKLLERDLFRPFADFLSVGNPQFFNRIHNHSTWGNAAVGMIGLVMGDEELVERALYGLKQDGISAGQKDNDSGYIKRPGQQKAGFLAQLDGSFSPDGYFEEGPYYLRYAIFPFLLFSKALANNRPDLGILDYRDGILKKAVFALLYQTDANGLFFPINDSQKGMSWMAREVVTAVDLAYFHYENDPTLLSIAKKQGKVILNEAGFAVARDLEKGLAKPFRHQSIEYKDGADGTQGGVGILRAEAPNDGELSVVMKYSAQGMGHGHFDKLSYAIYDDKGEILQDYGAARWVNIDQKGGGRYLPENQTWAKQSIAHNTLVVNETSHYEGNIEKGEAHHPDPYFFDGGNQAVQAVSAKDHFAYPGTEMHRTMVLLKDEDFHKPIVVDIFRIESAMMNQYDLPIWFQGHLLSTSFDYKTETNSLTTLGKDHGYQHLWKEAVGKAEGKQAQLTWFSQGRFYSMTTATKADDELIFARIGANDPQFNLRHDPAFILRRQARDAVFVSVLESHGEYSLITEIPERPFSSITSVEILHDDRDYTIVRFKNTSGKAWILQLANQEASKTATHKVNVGELTFNWQGPYDLMKNEE